MLACFRGGLEVIDSDQISTRPPELRRWGFRIRRKITNQMPTKVEKPRSTLTLLSFVFFFWIMTSDFSRVIRSCRWSVKLHHVVFTNHGHMQATENDPTGKRWKHHPSDDELRRMLGWKKQEGISCLSKRKTCIFWRSFFCLFQSVSSHGVCHVMNSSQHFEIDWGSSGKESIYSSLWREIFTNFHYPLLKYYATYEIKSPMCIIANRQWH